MFLRRRLFLGLLGICFLLNLGTFISAATIPNLRFLPGVFFVPPQPPNPVFEDVEISTGNNSAVVLRRNEDCNCTIGSVGNTAPLPPPLLPTTTIASGAVIELGSGVIPTHVVNNGYAAVGSFLSVGDLSVQGDFSVEEDAYLYFDVKGTDPGEYDLIRAYRQFSTGGTIRIVFRNGYAPQAGEIVPLVHAPSFAFDYPSPEKFEFANITSSPFIEISISNNVFGIKFYANTTFVPEPCTLTIASSALLFLIGRSRRV